MNLTQEATLRIAQLPHHLHTEFPHASVPAIETDVREQVSHLTADANFDDYVPLLAHRAVRQHLRDQASSVTAHRRGQPSMTRATDKHSTATRRRHLSRRLRSHGTIDRRSARPS